MVIFEPKADNRLSAMTNNCKLKTFEHARQILSLQTANDHRTIIEFRKDDKLHSKIQSHSAHSHVLATDVSDGLFHLAEIRRAFDPLSGLRQGVHNFH